MAIKEINEFNEFIGSAGASATKIAEDPTVPKILAELLANFQTAQEGIGGFFPNYRTEAAAATIGDKESRRELFDSEFSAAKLNETTKYDISNFVHGFQCIIEAAMRSGREGLAEDLVTGKLSVSDLQAGKIFADK